MTQAVDYSFARPAPADIVAAGYVGVLRYLAPRPNQKVIDSGEQTALHDVGLKIGYVWETIANRAGQGGYAGAQDARQANSFADELGISQEVPLYYAVDFQAGWEQVRPYFEGAESVGGRPVRPYGCYDVIEGWGRPGWQCAAWSGNGSGTGGSIDGRRVSQHAVLYQKVGYVLNNTCDVNEVLSDDWGGWHPNQTPVPTPVEDDMPDLRRIAHRTDGAIFVLWPHSGDRAWLETPADVDKWAGLLTLSGVAQPHIGPDELTDWAINQHHDKAK